MDNIHIAVDTLICDNEDTVWGAILIVFSEYSPSYKVVFSSIDNLKSKIEQEIGVGFEDINSKSFVNLFLDENGVSWKMANYRKINLNTVEILSFNFNRPSIIVEPYKMASFLNVLIKSQARYVSSDSIECEADLYKVLIQDLDFDAVTMEAWIPYKNNRYNILTASGNLCTFKILIFRDMETLFRGFNIKFTQSSFSPDYLVGEVSSDIVVSDNTDLIRTVVTDPFRLTYIGMPISMLLVNQKKLDILLIEYSTLRLIDNKVVYLPPTALKKESLTYRTNKSDMLSYPTFRTTTNTVNEDSVKFLRRAVLNIAKRAREEKVRIAEHPMYKELCADYGDIEVSAVLQAVSSVHGTKITDLQIKSADILYDILNAGIIINTFKKAVRLYGIEEFKDIIKQYGGLDSELTVNSYKEETYAKPQELISRGSNGVYHNF